MPPANMPMHSYFPPASNSDVDSIICKLVSTLTYQQSTELLSALDNICSVDFATKADQTTNMANNIGAGPFSCFDSVAVQPHNTSRRASMSVLGGANYHTLPPPGPMLDALFSSSKIPIFDERFNFQSQLTSAANASTPLGSRLLPVWSQPMANFGPATLPPTAISESRLGTSEKSSPATEASLDNNHDTTYSKSSTDAELQSTSTAESSSGTDHESDKSARKRTRYQCEECLKYFTRPSSLTTHIYTHTGEKPHECSFPGCSKKFSVLSNLRRHMKLHQYPTPRPRRRNHHHRHYYMAHPYDQHIFPAPPFIEIHHPFGLHLVPEFAYQMVGEPLFGPPELVPVLPPRSVLPPPQHQQQQQFQQQNQQQNQQQQCHTYLDMI